MITVGYDTFGWMLCKYPLYCLQTIGMKPSAFTSNWNICKLLKVQLNKPTPKQN